VQLYYTDMSCVGLIFRSYSVCVSYVLLKLFSWGVTKSVKLVCICIYWHWHYAEVIWICIYGRGFVIYVHTVFR